MSASLPVFIGEVVLGGLCYSYFVSQKFHITKFTFIIIADGYTSAKSGKRSNIYSIFWVA